MDYNPQPLTTFGQFCPERVDQIHVSLFQVPVASRVLLFSTPILSSNSLYVQHNWMQLVTYVNTTYSYVPRHRSFIHVHFTVHFTARITFQWLEWYHRLIPREITASAVNLQHAIALRHRCRSVRNGNIGSGDVVNILSRHFYSLCRTRYEVTVFSFSRAYSCSVRFRHNVGCEKEKSK